MPASLLEDMNSHSGGLEDQRALQIALELSMLGLNPEEEGSSPPAINPPFEDGHKLKRSANMTECVPVPSSEHVAEIVGRQGEYLYCQHFCRTVSDSVECIDTAAAQYHFKMVGMVG